MLLGLSISFPQHNDGVRVCWGFGTVCMPGTIALFKHSCTLNTRKNYLLIATGSSILFYQYLSIKSAFLFPPVLMALLCSQSFNSTTLRLLSGFPFIIDCSILAHNEAHPKSMRNTSKYEIRIILINAQSLITFLYW